jgi:hypothetical protein
LLLVLTRCCSNVPKYYELNTLVSTILLFSKSIYFFLTKETTEDFADFGTDKKHSQCVKILYLLRDYKEYKTSENVSYVFIYYRNKREYIVRIINQCILNNENCVCNVCFEVHEIE